MDDRRCRDNARFDRPRIGRIMESYRALFASVDSIGPRRFSVFGVGQSSRLVGRKRRQFDIMRVACTRWRGGYGLSRERAPGMGHLRRIEVFYTVR